MRTLDSSATAQVLPYPELCHALLQVFLSIAQPGVCHCPPRTHIPLGPAGELMLLMAATDATFAVTKVVTIHPSNRPPTPTVQSDVVVTRTSDGLRLLQCNGNVVTERRTSAVSIAALTLLLPTAKRSAPLCVVIVGGGVQANAHRQAIEACFSAHQHEFRMFPRLSSTASGATAFGVTGDDLRWADVIITATASAQPVLSEEACGEIRHDAVVCAVGAFRPSMAELPPLFVQRCRVVVDTVAGCESEAGDLLQAGIQFPAGVEDISSVAVAASRNSAHGNNNDSPSLRPTLFKSVGSALWELAAAHCMVSCIGQEEK